MMPWEDLQADLTEMYDELQLDQMLLAEAALQNRKAWRHAKERLGFNPGQPRGRAARFDPVPSARKRRIKPDYSMSDFRAEAAKRRQLARGLDRAQILRVRASMPSPNWPPPPSTPRAPARPRPKPSRRTNRPKWHRPTPGLPPPPVPAWRNRKLRLSKIKLGEPVELALV